MTIVFLDSHTLNPGDLDWAALEALGTVTRHDRTQPEQIIDRLAGADIALVNKVKLSRETLSQLPNLRYIGVTATGYDIIDVTAAREKNIAVTNVKGYSTPSVAQVTFALLLELTHHVGQHDRSVHAGEWVASPDFCYWKSPLIELAGKTLGLVGYGDIGKQVADVGRAFGMNVLVNRRHTDQQPESGIRYVERDVLFAESDVVSLHCPATPDTIGFVDADLVSQMKPTSFLLNTSRGSLLNEQAVANALNTGIIAGAGLDVLATEPPSADNPLLTARNCIITPHIAWASFEARKRLLHEVIENVRAFESGEKRNRV